MFLYCRNWYSLKTFLYTFVVTCDAKWGESTFSYRPNPSVRLPVCRYFEIYNTHFTKRVLASMKGNDLYLVCSLYEVSNFYICSTPSSCLPIVWNHTTLIVKGKRLSNFSWLQWNGMINYVSVYMFSSINCMQRCRSNQVLVLFLLLYLIKRL